MILGRVFESIEPVEICAGLYEQEIKTTDAFWEPDAWAYDRSGAYIYKPGLRHIAEGMGYARHEAGALFGVLVGHFIGQARKHSGVLFDNDAPFYLDNWGRPYNPHRAEYSTMFILGTEAVREIVRDELLSWRMSERRKTLLVEQLSVLATNVRAHE